MKLRLMQSKTPLFVILATLTSAAILGCGGDDGDKDKFGRVEGTIYLPGTLAAAPQPAVGVLVNLAGGDFNENRTTDSQGRFGFNDVPVGDMTLSVTPGECLADTQVVVTVLEDDTVTRNVTLSADVSGDCLSLPFSGAMRMEIDASSNRAVLLYDIANHAKPTIMRVDLTTGVAVSTEFDDIANVFDMAFVTSDLVVFNCLKTGSGYFLRFFDIGSMAVSGSDVMYTTNQGNLPGHLAVTPTGSDVFVTHRTQSGFLYDGQIFCINVSQRNLQSADDDLRDSLFAFDTSLVSGSINWPYDIAIDPARNELLVGNHRDTFVTAIDYTLWGTFDRSAGLVAPITGVRKIPMSTGVSGFRPYFWDFAGTAGIAAHPSYGMLAYQSGGSTHSAQFFDASLSLTSVSHHLTIHPTRGTWYTLVKDAGRPQSVWEAVEERSLTTLARMARFETRFQQTPALDPSAFAVNTQTNTLYVAYANKAILEIFELP